MTRSGLASATLWATCANGQSAGLLQSWNLPLSSSSAALALLVAAFAALSRQPVSPNAAIDIKVALGRGSGEFSTLAEAAPAGIGSSQTRTGNVASGRARTFIGGCAPSIVMAGQATACGSPPPCRAPSALR